MALLGVDELLKYAILIEENGEAFYRHWANRTENQNQKKVFKFLADEEKDHKRTFERMMNRLETTGVQPGGIDNKEYEDYLEKVSQEVMFNKKNFDEETKDVIDLSSAVNFAMKKELDSLIFYMDLKKFVPREHVEVMDKIIKEEQNHYTNLEEFKKQLLIHEIK
jgi:rubrerythrin